MSSRDLSSEATNTRMEKEVPKRKKEQEQGKNGKEKRNKKEKEPVVGREIWEWMDHFDGSYPGMAKEEEFEELTRAIYANDKKAFMQKVEEISSRPIPEDKYNLGPGTSKDDFFDCPREALLETAYMASLDIYEFPKSMIEFIAFDMGLFLDYSFDCACRMIHFTIKYCRVRSAMVINALKHTNPLSPYFSPRPSALLLVDSSIATLTWDSATISRPSRTRTGFVRQRKPSRTDCGKRLARWVI